MPLTFAQYLKTNTTKKSRRGSSGTTGYYYGLDYPHNDQSVGDVTGSSISGGGEDEELDLDGEQDVDQNNIQDVNPQDDTDPSPQTTDVENQDPDKQGAVRVIKGARLVYKRETDEGTFEELWIYKMGNHSRDEYEIRKDILAGTDIPVEGTASEDGTQTYSMWTSGDAQMIKIAGLPN
jgi:hypothetical protein